MRILDQPSPDVKTALGLMRPAAGKMRRYFSKPYEAQELITNDDRYRTKSTACGRAISDFIVGALGRLGARTATEEYKYTHRNLRHFLTDFDDPDAWRLDPDDGTRDYLQALEAGIEVSLATISLAKLEAGRPRIGALCMPLLDGPTRTYVAEEGAGAYCSVEGEASPTLGVDASQSEGIVLVAENNHHYIDVLAEQKGITVVRMGAIAFKMLTVVDPTLVLTYQKRLSSEEVKLFQEQPIIGMASTSAAAHDVMGATVVCREAGAIVTTITGSEDLPRGEGTHGILVANNPTTHGILLGAIAA